MLTKSDKFTIFKSLEATIAVFLAVILVLIFIVALDSLQINKIKEENVKGVIFSRAYLGDFVNINPVYDFYGHDFTAIQSPNPYSYNVEIPELNTGETVIPFLEVGQKNNKDINLSFEARVEGYTQNMLSIEVASSRERVEIFNEVSGQVKSKGLEIKQDEIIYLIYKTKTNINSPIEISLEII